MSGKHIATQNMTIMVKPPATGDITLISQPSQTNLIKNSPIYSGPLQFTVANLKSPDCGSVTPGTLPMGVIMPTAQKTNVGGQPVIRVGDKADGLVSVGAQMPGSPNPVSCVITFTVEIIDAGQTEVTAE